MDSAREVFVYIDQLTEMLPPDTDIIVCSDHSFNFIDAGDSTNGHSTAAHAFLAVNFDTPEVPIVGHSTIAQLIYELSGGDPEYAFNPLNPVKFYPIYGSNILK